MAVMNQVGDGLCARQQIKRESESNPIMSTSRIGARTSPASSRHSAEGLPNFQRSAAECAHLGFPWWWPLVFCNSAHISKPSEPLDTTHNLHAVYVAELSGIQYSASVHCGILDANVPDIVHI
jgi:hypothetical protein